MSSRYPPKSDNDLDSNTPFLPTYEESQSLIIEDDERSPTNPKSTPTPSLTLKRQILQSRSTHLSTLSQNSIIPEFLKGFVPNSTVQNIILVILPSDVSRDLQDVDFDASNIVTPSQGGRTVVLKLSGPENASEFWRQEGVLRELVGYVVGEISVGGNDRDCGYEKSNLKGQEELPPRPEESGSKRGKQKQKEKERDPTGSTGRWNLGWRGPEIGFGRSLEGELHSQRRKEERVVAMGNGGVNVAARFQDVVFRYMTPLGLWESRNVGCIWMEISVRI